MVGLYCFMFYHWSLGCTRVRHLTASNSNGDKSHSGKQDAHVWFVDVMKRFAKFLVCWDLISMRLLAILRIVCIAGWWFGTFSIFPYVGNVIIPLDEVIFFRGVALWPIHPPDCDGSFDFIYLTAAIAAGNSCSFWLWHQPLGVPRLEAGAFAEASWDQSILKNAHQRFVGFISVKIPDAEFLWISQISGEPPTWIILDLFGLVGKNLNIWASNKWGFYGFLHFTPCFPVNMAILWGYKFLSGRSGKKCRTRMNQRLGRLGPVIPVETCWNCKLLFSSFMTITWYE